MDEDNKRIPQTNAQQNINMAGEFEEDENDGGALSVIIKVVGTLVAIIGGCISIVVSINTGKLMTVLACLAGSMLLGVFMWGFGEIIALLYDIRKKLYEHKNDDNTKNAECSSF